MNAIELYQKYKNIKPEVVEIVQRLQQLRNNGLQDPEIEQVIKDLDLPLGLHLYITGHYSNLMKLKFNGVI